MKGQYTKKEMKNFMLIAQKIHKDYVKSVIKRCKDDNVNMFTISSLACILNLASNIKNYDIAPRMRNTYLNDVLQEVGKIIDSAKPEDEERIYFEDGEILTYKSGHEVTH